MAFLLTAATVLLACGVGWWLLFRRRAPRLKDENLSSIASSVLATRPDLSLHVVDRLDGQERTSVKDAFLAGPDIRWMTVGGDGQADIQDEETKKLHKEFTHFLLECVIRFAENYGHVVVCRDKTTQEFLGALHIVPPYTSSRLFHIHFAKSLISMGKPPFYQHGKATSARFDAFTMSLGQEHEQFIKDQPHWYIQNLGVVPKAQGRGVGRLLMESAKALAGSQPVYLECHDDNVPFYEKCGMKVQKRILFTPKIPDSDDSNAEDAASFPYNCMLYEP